jgi:hypothetical protein
MVHPSLRNHNSANHYVVFGWFACYGGRYMIHKNSHSISKTIFVAAYRVLVLLLLLLILLRLNTLVKLTISM